MLDPGKYYHSISKIRLIWTISILLLLLIACKADHTKTEDKWNGPWPIPRIEEDLILDRLAVHFVEEAQDSNNRNKFIENIVDRRWDMVYQEPGFFFHIVKQGTDHRPVWGDKVTVHYIGYRLDGTPFDSSLDRNQPFSFYVGNVIAGWNAALPLMGVGGRGVFVIPSDLAYGEQGFGSYVDPNEDLLFEIELLAIVD